MIPSAQALRFVQSSSTASIRAWRTARSLGMVFLSSTIVLSGCANMPVVSTAASTPTSQAQGAALHGRVHGGQQPITGAKVYLYAVGIGGYGGVSKSLLNGPGYVTTDGNGDFDISGDYTCGTNQQVYVYAVGGNPGLAQETDNTAAGLLAGLGSCATLTTSKPFVFVNEVSTIATAYALAGFATDATDISSSGSPLALTGVANAMATIPNLETLGTGVALATSPGGYGQPAQDTINTLANILAACINSTGSISGPTNPTPCYTLLTSAMNGSTMPTDTATAAINIAHNPGANVGALYGLQTASSPFQPDASSQPNDLTLQVAFPGPGTWGFYNSLAIDGSGDVWVVGGFGTAGNGFGELLADTLTWSTFTPVTGGGLSDGNPADIVIDPSENVWTNINACNGCSNNLVEVNSSGTILSGASGYDSSGEQYWYADIPNNALASDGSGNIFIATDYNSDIFEYIPGTGYSNTGGYGGGGLHGPNMLAVDTSGDVWAANGSDVAEIDPAGPGSDVSPSGGYTGGGQDYSLGIAIDGSGKVWLANDDNSSVSELSSSGTAISPSTGITGGGLAGVFYVAVDGANNVWAACGGGDGAASVLVELSNTGAILSGPNGYGYGPDFAPLAMNEVAIDGSGNVWTNNPGSYDYLVEFVGAAAPVVTPLAANLTSPYGQHTVNLP
jgi:hypothetical protein